MFSFPQHPSPSGRNRRRLVFGAAGFGLFAALRPDALLGQAQAAGGDLAANELQRADQRAQLCSATNLAGVGLRGEYFANEKWGGPPLLTRVDGPVDFDNSFDWPASRPNDRPRSVRWSGWVRPPLTGLYRFHAGVANARLVVATQRLEGPGAAADASIQLAAGRYYPVSLEVDHLPSTTGRVRLEWTAPHGSRFVVPRALLYLPTDSVTPSKS